MGLLSRNAGSLLAVDIGAAAVKLVQLASRRGECLVTAGALEPLPPNAVTGGNVNDPGAIGEAVARAAGRAGCRAKRAAVAMPGASVATRTIAVDAALSDSEIEVEVALEARQQMPFGDQELALDFEVLQLSATDPSRLDVAVTACRRDAVRQREAVLRRAGLAAALVDVESHCLQRLVAAQSVPGEAVAVADIGCNSVKLLAVRGESVPFAHAEPFAGHALAGAEGGAAREALLQLLARLAGMAAASTPSLARLALAGGGASVPGLAEDAESALGLPAAILRPFAAMRPAANVDAALLADGGAPAMAIACGLALRGIATTPRDPLS